MAFYDIFNGDADGLCGLHQLRLLDRRDAVLVTGAKREIALLERIAAAPGDSLTVLDVSMHENRAGLLRALHAGARCLYFDHHYPGEIPGHPALEAHIQYAPNVCTSLIVDAYVGQRFRAWAVTAAFGDNLHQAARHAAEPLGLSAQQLELLRELGECLNYNAYGDGVADLYFHPAELYRRLAPFDDPFEFVRHDSAFETLRGGFAADLALARSITPRIERQDHLLVALPDTAWARRVSGTLANLLSREAPARAHAVLVARPDGYVISVRAPEAAPAGADALCRKFGGSGRPGAAGINLLKAPDLPLFERAFLESFQP
jgi:DNA-binding NarL/FixJ family response regulator